MKSSYLTLRKIIKIVATRGQILRQKMHQIRLPSQTPLGSAPPDSLDFRGPISKGGKGRKKGGEKGRGKGEREGAYL